MAVHIVDHPLVQDALVTLRDKRTAPESFRRAANQISVLLAAEALRDLPTSEVTVDTPMGLAEGRRVSTEVVVVPILRAGLGMLDAVLELVPSARGGSGHTLSFDKRVYPEGEISISGSGEHRSALPGLE